MRDYGTIAVCAAHPDDETIGMGARLAATGDAWVLHVTDGAPRDMRDAAAYGFRTREEYAEARRAELLKALALAGIPEGHAYSLGVADQEASYELASLARRIAELIEHHRFAAIFSPAYEGGHPDHDATAFAVHAACGLIDAPPPVYEYALYHCRGGAFVPFEFVPYGSAAIETHELTPAERALKRRMLDCFRTQRETLRPFGCEVERFRRAPVYDFASPPPAERIYYDWFPWGIRSGEWVARSRAALAVLAPRGAALC